MSSRKRSRDLRDDGSDEEVEIESASSSFRQQSHSKRSRIALAAERGGSVVSDEDDDSGMDIEMNKYGREDTAAFSSDAEEEEDEADELRATQAVEKQVRQHRDNIASEQGIIEEVYCRNFMCHSKLRIKLGPLINFIIGHNGSGKSAVLTALTMCLGGKATATNRGASLKSLIKEGEESATLAVKIKNRGDGAYKPELYGQSITVERNFTRSGTSGFKIKNSEDKTITTKKADLDDILDFFAFQLDNPINVLTQDMARQFLSNSSAGEKYKFFIRGTQLETLDADYKLMEEHLDNMQSKLHSREDDIAILKQKAVDAEQRKKRLDAAQGIQDKIKKTQWMHAWAQVEEQERVLEQYNKEAEDAEEEVSNKNGQVETISGTYEGHDQAWERAKDLVVQLNERIEPTRAEHATAKEAFDHNKAQLVDLKGEEREIKNNVKKNNDEIKRLNNEIRDEKARLEGAQGAEHTERLAELDRLKEKVETAKQTQAEHDEQAGDLEKTRKDAVEELDLGQPAVDQAKSSLRQEKAQLQSTQASEGRPFDGYHKNMEQLVRAINRETRWRHKPVGPVGRHIRLLDIQWQCQIERVFGRVLESFICTNKDDQTLLSQLMKKTQCEMGLFIGDPTPLDTTGKEPREGISTILRTLRIDSPLVRNQLIINQGIDQYALVKTRAEAQNIMYTAREQNVKIAMALGSRAGDGIRFERSRMGEEKSSPVAKWVGPLRMKTDREQQILAERERVNAATRDLDSAEQQMRSLKTAVEKANQAVTAFKRKQKTNLLQFQQAQDDVAEHQNLIESKKPQDGKLQALQGSLEEAQSALEQDQGSYQDFVVAKDKLNDSARTLKERMDTTQGEVDEAQTRITKAEDRVTKMDQARVKALMEKNMAFNELEESKAKLGRVTERRDTQKKRVQEDFVTGAARICARVEVEPGVTATILDDRLERFIKELQDREREAGGSREELTLAWQKARKEYRDAEDQIAEMKNVEKMLLRTLASRHKRWKMFRKYISYRARFMFSYLLSERQFRGRVLVDHSNKLLDIKVEPDLAKTSDAGRETKTLSGGEKSFSTICLLLSIWDAMGSPIRCLDEFDVFMDSVNRATSMQMMIQAARRSVGRQFILITPQAMNNTTAGDDVRIYRMSDPERGQQTLSF